VGNDNLMKCYGVGILNDVQMGQPIVEYLERIDATLAPYDGYFIVHGGTTAMLEGAGQGLPICSLRQWLSIGLLGEVLSAGVGDREGRIPCLRSSHRSRSRAGAALPAIRDAGTLSARSAAVIL
jgi:hypothetical protein